MKSFVTLVACILCALLFISPAQALQCNLSIKYSGDTPLFESPWLTASFEDTEKEGVVKLTMTSEGLVSTEFVSEWTFNLNPSFNAANLIFEYVSGNQANKLGAKNNEFKAGGDGFYDIEFQFFTAGAKRFDPGEDAVYLIYSSEAGLNALSFDSKSDPGNISLSGPFTSAAHVQGIPKGLYEPTGSGWIADPGEVPVPEPGTLLLMGLGLIGIALVMREML